mmetsp:Transcript_9982/g.27957  ORF Transcript_9982/g.27957 Transcript_9982/m.27957 type:complete len:180 (+) Transcript_9982:633-1172(+)
MTSPVRYWEGVLAAFFLASLSANCCRSLLVSLYSGQCIRVQTGLRHPDSRHMSVNRADSLAERSVFLADSKADSKADILRLGGWRSAIDAGDGAVHRAIHRDEEWLANESTTLPLALAEHRQAGSEKDSSIFCHSNENFVIFNRKITKRRRVESSSRVGPAKSNLEDDPRLSVALGTET